MVSRQRDAVLDIDLRDGNVEGNFARGLERARAGNFERALAGDVTAVDRRPSKFHHRLFVDSLYVIFAAGDDGAVDERYRPGAARLDLGQAEILVVGDGRVLEHHNAVMRL